MRLGAPISTFVPTPAFSSDNPYWRESMLFLYKDYRPRPSMTDFLMAQHWELNRPDIYGATLVREASMRTYKFSILSRKLKYTETPKEKTHEEVH